MGGLSIGPLVFSAERAPVLIALLVFLGVTGLLSRRYGGQLGAWGTTAALVSALAARLGFVAQNFATYKADPLAIFAFWQGGFSPIWGAIGFAVVTALFLRRHSALLIPAAVSLALAAVAWNLTNELAKGASAGLPTDVTLVDLDGQPVETETWLGQPTVINLWATWCLPCRREMPMMAEVASAETDVALRFVNQGEGAATISAYLDREGIELEPQIDMGMKLMQHFQSQGLPATLFIDAEGKLQAAHMGEISRAQLLRQIELLKAPGS